MAGAQLGTTSTFHAFSPPFPRRLAVRTSTPRNGRLVAAKADDVLGKRLPAGGGRRHGRPQARARPVRVLEACRRMAARRVDAALLTDSNALLRGILTDKVHAVANSLLSTRKVEMELPMRALSCDLIYRTLLRG